MTHYSNFDDSTGKSKIVCSFFFGGKMARIGKKFRLYRLFMVSVLLFPAGSLSAQPKSHYLNAVPIPPIAKTSATGPAITQNTAQPVAGIAASPKRKMTLAEISAMATQNHPGVQQAQRQAEALRGMWIQAGLRSNPSIGYSMEELSKGNAGTQGVTFSQPVTPRYKLDARQAAVNRDYQAALQVVQIQCQKAINDATLAAYRVAFAYQKCLILEELTRISQESQRIGDELFRAQEIGRSANLDISIHADRTLIALKDAETAYRTVCMELITLLALSGEELIEITDPVVSLPAELDKGSLLAEIETMCPETQQALAEVNTAKARLRQQYAEAGIDFDTNAKIAYNTETKQSEFSVGVAVPLRLFDRNQGNIKQAQSELAAACRNVERLERLHALKFERHWGEYQAARNRVVIYQEKILSKASESLALALAAYRRGEYSSLELLDSQRTFSTVQNEYLDSLNALMESQILLQGRLLTGGLEKPGTD